MSLFTCQDLPAHFDHCGPRLADIGFSSAASELRLVSLIGVPLGLANATYLLSQQRIENLFLVELVHLDQPMNLNTLGVYSH
jgi:hypothetical protein